MMNTAIMMTIKLETYGTTPDYFWTLNAASVLVPPENPSLTAGFIAGLSRLVAIAQCHPAFYRFHL